MDAFAGNLSVNGSAVRLFVLAVAGVLASAPALGWLLSRFLPTDEGSKMVLFADKLASRIPVLSGLLVVMVVLLWLLLSTGAAKGGEATYLPGAVADDPAPVAGDCGCNPCRCEVCRCETGRELLLSSLLLQPCTNGRCGTQPEFIPAQRLPVAVAPTVHRTVYLSGGNWDTGPAIIGTRPVTLPLRPVGVRQWEGEEGDYIPPTPVSVYVPVSVPQTFAYQTGGGCGSMSGERSEFFSSSSLRGASSERRPVLRIAGGPGVIRSVFGRCR